ncbi:MAG: hypothetical protein ABI336_04565 [Humibacillus sp.]
MTRESWLRGAAVVAITAVVTLAAACSDKDTVDTVPPPWPTRTSTPAGPGVPPVSTPAATSTVSSTVTPTVTSKVTPTATQAPAR